MTIGSMLKKIYQKYPDLPFRDSARALYWRYQGDPNRLYRKFRDVASTPPLHCNPGAETGLHTLTCHNHVYMYLTAMKSLLRYFSDLAVVVHDDGSLTERDIALLQRHITGINVIRRTDADHRLRDPLQSAPRTAAYRAEVSNAQEITDHIPLATTEKIIITNSDILFLQPPEELIRWIRSGERRVLCVYEAQPREQHDFVARMGSSFPPHLTLALVCLWRGMADVSELEQILGRTDPADARWFLGQNSLPVLLGNQVDLGGIEFLDQKRYQASGIFTDGAVFRHYWTSIANLRPHYFADAATVIAELKSIAQ